MPSLEEVARQPLARRLARMAQTPDDYEAAIRGHDDAALSRRPEAAAWAAKEVVCHVRDNEEFVMARVRLIMAVDEPTFLGAQPDQVASIVARWAEDRQYLRQDTAAALVTFRRRRRESLDDLATLGPRDFARGGIHSVRGRMTIDDFVTQVAWHDDNHLDQIRRALEGKA
ncbi:MAG: DinB family protein [Candidatus Rokubacteria bacterium]|nr:DinB family protein [Candidatus Rokubacteria bacterium]